MYSKIEFHLYLILKKCLLKIPSFVIESYD